MSPDTQKHAPSTRPALRWGRILLILILSLLLLLSGGIAWLLNDTEQLKTGIEKLVSNLTDRSFQIHGDFDYKLGSQISITATEVEWANAAWSSQPTMLTIKSIQASVDLRSLLSPPIIISNVVAADARLDFEWNQAKESNWLLVSSDKPDTPKDTKRHPLPLLLDAADLSNVELYFRHPALTEELQILVESAQQQQDETNRLVLDIESIFDGRKMEIDGRIGPFPELIIAGKVDFDLRTAGPHLNMDIKASFDNLASLDNPDINFAIAAPDIATVLDILNLPPITSGEIDLKGALQADMAAADGFVNGIIGDFNVDATMHADSMRPLQGISANISSNGPSASTAGAIIGLEGLPEEPYSVKVEIAESTEGLLVKQADINMADAHATASGIIRSFPEFHNIDLELAANVPDIARFKNLLPGKDIPKIPLKLDASIKSDSELAVDLVTAKMTIGMTDLSVTGKLTGDSQFVGSDFEFAALLPDTLQFGKLSGLPIRRAVRLSANGQLNITNSGLRLNDTAGKLGQHAFNVDGDINFIATDFNSKLKVSTNGPNIEDLVTLFTATDQLPALPYKLSGELALTARQLKLTPVKGTLGPNNIRTQGSLSFDGKPININLNIAADGPSLSDLLVKQKLGNIPDEAYRLSGDLKLDQNGIKVTNIDFDISGGNVQGAIENGWPKNPKQMAFDIKAQGPDLSKTLPTTPGYIPAAAPFSAVVTGQLSDNHVEFKQLDITLGAANIDLSGRLNLPPDLHAKNIKLHASGPRLTDLGAFSSWKFAAAPFNISASMEGTVNSVSMNDLLMTIGPSDLRGKFNLDYGERPTVNLSLDSNLLNISALQERLDDEQPAEEEPQNDATVTRLIPEVELPLDLLKSFDANVAVNIKELITQRITLSKLSVNGSLQAGKLDLERVQANTAKGTLSARLSMTPVGNSAQIETAVTAKNLVLALGELDDVLRKDHPGQDIDLYLTGSGANLRDVAGSLNGFAWLRGGKRQVAAAQLGMLFGDFLSEIINTVNPFSKKDPYQTLKCDRLFFEATDGVLQTSPAILFRTDKINIRSVGALSLRTEKIDFSIETTPRKGIGLSASDLVNPFIKIGGTMSSPSLIPNATGTLIEGGAAVATMGISIVAKSMYKRWLSPRNPCESLTEDARTIRSKRDPNHVPTD